jgi:hypothetical protein
VAVYKVDPRISRVFSELVVPYRGFDLSLVPVGPQPLDMPSGPVEVWAQRRPVNS